MDEWAVGDVGDPGFVSGITAGVDVVISALGVTRQRANLWDIDHRANLAVLEDAERRDVRLFTFIHALGADECPAELTKAKSAFVRRLVASPITHQVLRPSAYFSDIAQILNMARKGRVYLMRPGARVNPIHPADLASCGLDRVDGGAEGIWDVGGPETLTWEKVGQLASGASVARALESAARRHAPIRAVGDEPRHRRSAHRHSWPRGVLPPRDSKG